MLSRDIINVIYLELNVGEFFGFVPFNLSTKVSRNSLLAVKSNKSSKILQRWEIFSVLLGILTILQIYSAVGRLKRNIEDILGIWNLIVIAFHGYILILTIANSFNLRAFGKHPIEWKNLLNNLLQFSQIQKRRKY